MLNPNHGICFAKIGQAAFNPAHFVPGIGPSPTRCCKAACSSTPISTAAGSMPPHMHTAVNQPHSCSCIRESSMRTDGNQERERN